MTKDQFTEEEVKTALMALPQPKVYTLIEPDVLSKKGFIFSKRVIEKAVKEAQERINNRVLFVHELSAIHTLDRAIGFVKDAEVSESGALTVRICLFSHAPALENFTLTVGGSAAITNSRVDSFFWDSVFLKPKSQSTCAPFG